MAMVSCLFRIWDGLSVNGMVYSAQQIGIYEIGGIDIIMWNELGISGGTAIVILIALYFVIKWAVKNGIKEAYSAITGKKTDEDIKNEKELKELGLDSENQYLPVYRALPPQGLGHRTPQQEAVPKGARIFSN